jgi:hypothetical protein
MKLGLICPVPHLRDYAGGEYHLALYHLLSNDEYRDHYARTGLFAYITLDNSAFELGEGANDVRALLDAAVSINASEMVIPDVMQKMDESIDLSLSCMEELALSRAMSSPWANDIRLMLVPQAETIYGWGKALNILVQAHHQMFENRPFTVGVSKVYDSWPGGRVNLIERFVAPMKALLPRMDVHLLGMSSDWVSLSQAALRFPWIRSVDSVKPFTYAMAGVKIPRRYGASPENPGRPEDYFTRTMTADEKHLAQYNIGSVMHRIQPNWMDL